MKCPPLARALSDDDTFQPHLLYTSHPLPLRPLSLIQSSIHHHLDKMAGMDPHYLWALGHGLMLFGSGKLSMHSLIH